MNLRRSVAKLLAEGRLEEIASLSESSPNVMSALVSRLYEADALARFRAADALGRVASRVMLRDREQVEQLLRKLGWSLNEESGATAWGAPQALGEVSRLDEVWAKQQVPLLVSYLDHEEVYLGTDILEQGVIWALGRIGELHPEAGRGAVEALMGRLGDGDGTTRGLAVWALGRMGAERSRELVMRLAQDGTLFDLYDGGQMRRVGVGELVGKVLG